MSDCSDNQTLPIPVTIITGFLGAGKTRFLFNLLALDEMSNSAVIINEFGEFGLDHLLVEHTSDQLMNLPNGCLCCDAHGELVEKILYLHARKISGHLNFDRIIIETSGITDTSNLLANLWRNTQINSAFCLSGIITLISALEWPDSRNNFTEANQQLAICDTVIVSKSDLLPNQTRDQELAHLEAAIRLVNSTAPCLFTPLTTEQMLDVASQNSGFTHRDSRTEEQGHNTGKYKTCTLQHNLPLPLETIEFFMDFLVTHYGDILLRAKGLVLTLEKPDRPLVIQAVKSTLSPVSWLKQWNDVPKTRVTIIHTGKNSDIFTELFDNLLNIPAIDQPDKSALSDNPLSIGGVGKFIP